MLDLSNFELHKGCPKFSKKLSRFVLTGRELDAVSGGGAVDRRALVRPAVVVDAAAVPVRRVAPQRRTAC